MSDSQEPLPTEKRRPVVLFADPNNKQRTQIQTRLDREGLEVRFADTVEQVVNELGAPEIFCVFVNIDFGGNALAVLKRLAPQSTALWIVLCGNISTQARSAIYQAGATDQLQLPTNPVQIFLRARMLLSKWVQKNDFSALVQLPSGYEWRSASASNSAPREGGMAPLSPSEISRIKGDKDESSSSKFIKGDAADGAQNQFIRGDRDSRDSDQHRRSKEPAPTNRSSTFSATEERSEPSVSIIRSDPKPSGPSIYIPTPTPKRESPGFRPFDEATARKDSDFKILKQESPQKVPTGSLSKAMGEEVQRRYLMLFEEIQREARTLEGLTAADRAQLALHRPAARFPMVGPKSFEGVNWAIRKFREFLASEAERVSAVRLSVVSLKPELRLGVVSGPIRVVALVSSDEQIRFNESRDAAAFPQIRLSYEKRKGIFVPRGTELEVPPGARADHWKIEEKASAVAPICGYGDPDILLLGQFVRPLSNDELIPFRDLAENLQKYPHAWRVLDFLARSYRDLEIYPTT